MAKLVEHLPRYYRGSKFIDDTLTAYDTEIDRLTIYTEEMQAQFIVKTATEKTLSRYEEEYGLEINPPIDIDGRRSRIIAKMRTVGVVTKALIQEVIESWANASVEITEDFANYALEVKFIDKLGIPPNIDDVYAAVNEIIPAHLGITYTFKYRRHEELRPYTHQYLSGFTHTNLREGAL